MPQPSRRPVSPSTRVITALAGVGVGVLIFVIVLQIAGPRSSEQAEPAEFNVGSAERRAEQVAGGGPLLFQDLLGGSKDIYVQHLGDDDWRTFEARAPGAGPGCVLEWQAESGRFVDPCDGDTYPADGEGLTTYPTRVEDGEVIVDLRPPSTPTTG